MSLTMENSIPGLVVFLQGILSFFSPCVLPLVPLYIGYLAGGTKTVDAAGQIHYPRKKVLINTVFFILGISFAFFLLGFGFTTAGKFFGQNRGIISRIGGILIIAFGLFQLGILGSNTLNKEKRLTFRLNALSMNPITALVLGFTFSFAWTPCVGPALASVLIMASSSTSSTQGFLLIGLYTLAFILPFLAVGFFTSAILGFFKKYQHIVQYTVKIGGILMIVMGTLMLTGWMNGITSYFSSPSPKQTQTEGNPPPSDTSEEETEISAPDFTLTDQFGQQHTLSDYKGKVVFLNFWATWCGYCVEEMPDIQALYEEHGKNAEDLVVLGVANPKTDEFPYNQDKPVDEIIDFLDAHSFTYPTLMDTTGEVLMNYGITSFPITFIIDAEGNLMGYIPGMVTKDVMDNIIQQVFDEKNP